ncbi:MAG: hypothetical protein AABW63_00830 [Nanoarchaeota archaeon]
MNLKNILMGIAIIILTIFVTYYGINMFFPSPEYNSFCKDRPYYQEINTSVQCEAAQGKWNPAYGNAPVEAVPIKGSSQGYCDLNYYCQKDWDDAMRLRSRNVFFIALPLGILLIAGGAFFFGLESVGAGLMGGGVGTLIYGSGAYWPFTENWVRFLLSLIGLVILIWFAYFLSKRSGKKRK